MGWQQTPIQQSESSVLHVAHAQRNSSWSTPSPRPEAWFRAWAAEAGLPSPCLSEMADFLEQRLQEQESLILQIRAKLAARAHLAQVLRETDFLMNQHRV